MFNQKDFDKLAIISDFDGTISKQDTNDLLFRTFGNSHNEYIERLFIEGRIGTREGMLRHFRELRLSEEEYTDFILNNVEIDDGFKAFYTEAKEHDIPLIIVSAGFVNGILPLLDRESIKHPQVYANRLIFGEEKIEVDFAHDIDKCSSGFGPCGNCKLRYLEEFREAGKKVVFIGDGLTDRCIAGKADLVFAKDALAQYCLDIGIPYIGYRDFYDINNRLFNV
jgi:2-hydroxy-3-keto-5-methylthiopentenyl-1-phosphate phosphatase